MKCASDNDSPRIENAERGLVSRKELTGLHSATYEHGSSSPHRLRAHTHERNSREGQSEQQGSVARARVLQPVSGRDG